MNNKSKIIILLIIVIIILFFNEYFEKFTADPICMNLSAPLDTPTCGNYKVNNGYCVPNPKDCFIDNITKEERCWCKLKNCTGAECNPSIFPENKLHYI